MKPVYLTICGFFLFNMFIISECSQAQTSADQSVKSSQILQTTTTWNGADLIYPNSGVEEITALHIEFAPGAETVWHRHPVPSLAYIIKGELEVIIKDTGEKKVFHSGDAFTEVINTWHYGKNVGDEPVKLVVFYVAEEGIKLTELFTETTIKEP